MKKGNKLLVKRENGEIGYLGLNTHMPKKFKADNPLDNFFVPYLIMAFCAVVDTSVFISLFKLISYDSKFMLGIQVAGFVFAFDVVPIYLGIHLKRIKQGLSKERFIFALALAVCVLACALNIVLRITTIDQISPDMSSMTTSYYGTIVENSSSNKIDSTAVSISIFGMVIPFLTSIGSFYISYITYHPLKVRQRREEEMLAVKKDEIRRLEAILSEYDACEEFAENLKQDDRCKFEEMKKMQKAVVAGYCDYVRLRLKQYIGNPTANNILSQDNCTLILERLNREIDFLDGIKCSSEYQINDYKVKTFIDEAVN